jgi:hypothetical protein
MDSALVSISASAPAPAPALDAKTLLVRVNQRLSLLRSWLSHDHKDEPYWWARHVTAREAQYERHILRQVANLLHVERATARGRVHGTCFPDLAAQRTWLDKWVGHTCQIAAAFIRLPKDASLALLREGKLPL